MFDLIYADPPWCYNDKCLHRGGAERHYGTITNETLRGLPIKKITAPSAALFLWATAPLLPDAISIMNSWGFTYKTVAFVWVKTTKSGLKLTWGMGGSTRANAELLLLGVKNKGLKRQSAGVHSVHFEAEPALADTSCLFHERTKHSRKPGGVRDLIVKLYGEETKRLEVFATENIPGWDAIGYEVDGLDIQDSLAKYVVG